MARCSHVVTATYEPVFSRTRYTHGEESLIITNQAAVNHPQDATRWVQDWHSRVCGAQADADAYSFAQVIGGRP